MNPPKLWFTHKQTIFSNSHGRLFFPAFRIRNVHSFLKTRNYRSTVSQNYKGWLLFQLLLKPYTIMTSQSVLCLSLHFLQQPVHELITVRYCLWSHTYRSNSFISPIAAIKTYTSKHSKYFVKKNPTRCNNVYKFLLFHIHMKLNMFRATHCPSSGA